MAWTTPITWVASVIYDETDLNQQIRDNMEVIKFSRNDAGKIHALTSTYFASLDASTITGINDFNTSNAWNMKNDFSGGNARVRVGARDNGIVYPGSERHGVIQMPNPSPVTSGIQVWWLRTFGGPIMTFRTYIGTSMGAAPVGSLIGSMWVEGTTLRYISRGFYIEVALTGTLVAAGSPGLPGSIWIEISDVGLSSENPDIHYIDEADAERVVS